MSSETQRRMALSPLDLAWLRYAVETEEYDRSLPGVMWRGEWMLRGDFLSLSRMYARELRILIGVKMKACGIDPDGAESRAARKWATELTLERARQYLSEEKPR